MVLFLIIVLPLLITKIPSARPFSIVFDDITVFWLSMPPRATFALQLALIWLPTMTAQEFSTRRIPCVLFIDMVFWMILGLALV